MSVAISWVAVKKVSSKDIDPNVVKVVLQVFNATYFKCISVQLKETAASEQSRSGIDFNACVRGQ